MRSLAALPLFLALPLCLGGCAGLMPATGQKEPAVQHLVSEDEHTRIDELRVRGQVVRVTVTPKNSAAPAYTIVPPSGGRDPSGEHPTAAGQRVWSVLQF